MKAAMGTLPRLVRLGILATALCATASVPGVQASRPAHASAKPSYGGAIAVRVFANLSCLDPQRTTVGDVSPLFADTLVSLDEHGRLRPDLALKWTVSQGGRAITFYLRHGVRFSNGDPLDAGSVKATFDRAVNPSTKSPVSASFLGPVEKVQVVNPYAVRIITKTPFRPLLTDLAYSGYLGILDPKALRQEGATRFCDYPVGSGPYKIQSVGPGLGTVTLTRNPYHTWEPAWAHNQGKPYLSTITFRVITSDSTAIGELLAGGVDVANVPGDQVSRVRHNPAIVLHTEPVQGEMYLGFNTAHRPFDTVQVRRAIAEAIDRGALIKAAESGLGIPAYSPLPRTLPYYDPKAKGYAPPYNPTAARNILSANHVTGPYTLLTFNFPDLMTAAELIQAELQQVGVNVKIEPKPVADYISAAQKGDYDLDITEWADADPDFLYQLFDSSQAAGSGLNVTFYKSARLDKLLTEGRTSLNTEAAATAYAAVQRFIDEKVIIDPLWTDVTLTGTRSRVRGWHTDITGVPLYADLYVQQR